jgi:hypothetical protein
VIGSASTKVLNVAAQAPKPWTLEACVGSHDAAQPRRTAVQVTALWLSARTGINGGVPALLRFLVLAALLVVAVVSTVVLARHRSATPLGAVDSSDTTRTISGEGAATLNPRILGQWSWLVVDSAGYLGFRDRERSSPAIIFGYLDMFCDHKVSKAITGQHDCRSCMLVLVWRPVDLAQPNHTPARGQPSTKPAHA